MNPREEIERLIFVYAEALDQGNVDQVAQLFARGCIRVAGQDQAMMGAEGVKRTLLRFTCFYDTKGRLVDPTREQGRPFTRHITSNLYFEYLRQDCARVHSCFTVIQGLPGRPIQIIVSGRYRDSFSCVDGAWHFTERYEYIDLVGDITHHLHHNPF